MWLCGGQDGDTPLHLAVVQSDRVEFLPRSEVAILLIQNRADMSIQDEVKTWDVPMGTSTTCMHAPGWHMARITFV